VAVLSAFERAIAQALEPYLGEPADESTRAEAKQPLRELLTQFEDAVVEIVGDWPEIGVPARRRATRARRARAECAGGVEGVPVDSDGEGE
jgi:hypothetical protein